MSTEPDAATTAVSSAESSAVVARLSEPDTERALLRLLDKLDKVEAMVDALGTLGQRMPVLAEGLGESAAWAYDQARAEGVEPIETGKRAAGIALQAAKPEMLDMVEKLMAKSGKLTKLLDLLDDIPEDDLAAVTTALVETRKEPTRMVTPLMALFKMGDPDLQRAIGFTMELGKRLGRILRDNEPT